MLVALLILCRVICVIGCLLYALGHLIFGLDEIVGPSLNVYAPYTTLTVFSFLMSMHLMQLIKMCCCKRRAITPVLIKSKAELPTTLWERLKYMYQTYLGQDGLFGRRGRYYSWKLVLREALEIPAQTYQGYMISRHIPYPIFPVIYGCVIALNCILVPVIMRSRHLTLMARRNGVLLLDIVFDTIIGAFMPLSLGLSALFAYWADPNIRFKEEFAAMAISSARQFMITSSLDLFITGLPFLYIHLMINSVYNNLLDVQSKYQLQSAGKSKVKRHWIMLGSIWSILWGLFILSEAIRAPYMSTCGKNNLCKLHVSPWFIYERRCDCLIVSFDCSTNPGLNTDTYGQLAHVTSRDISQQALYLIIRECHLESVPQEVATMPEMVLLSFRQTTLGSFDIDLSPCNTLWALNLFNSELSHFPEALHRLPKTMRTIAISQLSVNTLPSWVSTSWTNLRKLYMNDVAFDTFPSQILQLQDLRVLRLYNIPGITNLPTEIENLRHLVQLEIIACSLTELPSEITTLELQTATFSGNQLVSVPWSRKTIQDWNSKPGYHLFLRGNPVCQDLGQDIDPCSSGCSDTCPPTLYRNGICDSGCNSAICDWDGGDCK